MAISGYGQGLVFHSDAHTHFNLENIVDFLAL